MTNVSQMPMILSTHCFPSFVESDADLVRLWEKQSILIRQEQHRKAVKRIVCALHLVLFDTTFPAEFDRFCCTMQGGDADGKQSAPKAVTDVAARGLGIPDVVYVHNFRFSLTLKGHLYRIGRSGRAGKKGIAHTFSTQADEARAGELGIFLNEVGQKPPPELFKLGSHVEKESALNGAHFNETCPCKTGIQGNLQ